MSAVDERFTRKPETAKEVVRCLIWKGWWPPVAFYKGSKYCPTLGVDLIRGGVRAMRKRRRLPRYVLALSKAVRISESDKIVKQDWREAIKGLRRLYSTSPFGSLRQRQTLIEIAQNKLFVKAMRLALRAEKRIRPREIEPTWLAVLYAEGSEASIREANRFNRLLDSDMQVDLLGYLDE